MDLILEFPHTASSVTIAVSATLNSNADDESFSFNRFVLKPQSWGFVESSGTPEEGLDSLKSGLLTTFVPSDYSSDGWKSKVGDITASSKGSLGVTKDGFGVAGNKQDVTYVEGSKDDSIKFGDILSSEYTVCSLTRYTGSSKARILNGGTGNWMIGQHSNKAGIAYNNGWLAGSSGRVNPSTNWVAECYENKKDSAYYINGIGYKYTNGQTKVPEWVGINDQGAKTAKNEKSDFGIAYLATWDRHLSDWEMEFVTDWLLPSVPRDPENTLNELGDAFTVSGWNNAMFTETGDGLVHGRFGGADGEIF
jgi:hypothetical protein